MGYRLELMAYGSILTDGNVVRMSGQDVKRGTFSHRHAVLRDEETNAEYNRLNHFQEKQGQFRIYNSLLSEYGYWVLNMDMQWRIQML